MVFWNWDWFQGFIVAFLLRRRKPSRKTVRSKERNIFAARDTDSQLFVFALLQKVLLQPGAEWARIIPYNVIFAGAVTRPAAKNTNANLVFTDFVGPACNLAFTYIEQ